MLLSAQVLRFRLVWKICFLSTCAPLTPPFSPFELLLLFVCVCVCVCVLRSFKNPDLDPGLDSFGPLICGELVASLHVMNGGVHDLLRGGG